MDRLAAKAACRADIHASATFVGIFDTLCQHEARARESPFRGTTNTTTGAPLRLTGDASGRRVTFFDKAASPRYADRRGRWFKRLKFMTFFTLARRMHCLARRPSPDQLVFEMMGL
jgi:hypothetical protein